MSLYDSLEFSSSSIFLFLLTTFAIGQRIRELPIPKLNDEQQIEEELKTNGTVAKNLTATVENAIEPIKNAPHTLEGIRNERNGTMEEMDMMEMVMEGGHNHNHPHSSTPTPSLPTTSRPPIHSLLPFESLPIELLEEANSPKTTQKPLTTATTTTVGQIRLPQPVQPEEPVVLPAPLGDCVDGHENCPFWAKNGFCQNHFYTQQMRAHFCPSSCGLC